MDDTNPLLKRLMKDKKDDVVHSSAYANAQNAGKMGADSIQSFEVRQKIDENRSKIQGYQFSEIGSNSYKNKRNNKEDKETLPETNGASTEYQRTESRKTEVGNNYQSVNRDAKNTDMRAEIRNRFAGQNRGIGQTAPGGSTQGPTRMPTRINPGISR